MLRRLAIELMDTVSIVFSVLSVSPGPIVLLAAAIVGPESTGERTKGL